MATEAKPLVSGLNVVYLYVRDFERSVGFYRDVLGIPLESQPGWAEATLPQGIRFALHATADTSAELGTGTVRLDFEVEDIDEAVERLRAAGVKVGEIHREVYGSHAEFVDPDGYRLDLFQPPA